MSGSFLIHLHYHYNIIKWQTMSRNTLIMWNCSCIHYCSIAPADYISVSSEPLTFTRGSSSDSVTITIREDTIVEGLESFVARLSVNTVLYPGVRLAPDTADVHIRDNDGKAIQNV